MNYRAGVMPIRRFLLIAYFTVCTIALVWPVYARIGNHLQPFVLGLPLSFAWVIGWVLMTFAALIAYHFSGGERG